MKIFVTVAMLLASTTGATHGVLRASRHVGARGDGPPLAGNTTAKVKGKSEGWQNDMRTWWVEHPPSSLAQHIREQQCDSKGGSRWEYTKHPCIQGKFHRLAQIMKDEHCGPTVGEIGGGLNPMRKFYHDYKLYVDLEPAENLTTSEGAGGEKTMSLPFVLNEYTEADDFRAKFELPSSFDCVVAGGLYLPNEKSARGFREYISKANTVIVEKAGSLSQDTDGNRQWKKALAEVREAGFKEERQEVYDCTKDEAWMNADLKSVTDGADVGKHDGVNGWKVREAGEPMEHWEKIHVGFRNIWVFRK